MRTSVILPARSPLDDAVMRRVAGLVPQLAIDDEVLIAVDGRATGGPAPSDGRVRVLEGDRIGPGGARNRGLAEARGDLILFLNDDVVPHAGLLDAHRRAHAGAAGTTMVVGAAPWAVPADDRVIDRLVRETSLIFFYDTMTGDEPVRDWGFRHAWTLNLSVPRAMAPRFDERLHYPMFDDLEWAHRTALPVRYVPAARVTHEHRYTPGQLLARETLLGHQATVLHRIAPACGRDVFGERFLPSGRAPAPGDDAIETACVAYTRFAAIASEPVSPARVATIGRLFETSRVWRDIARDLGCGVARAGGSANDALRRLQETMMVLPATEAMPA